MQNDEITNESEVEIQDTPVEVTETPEENQEQTTQAPTVEEQLAQAKAEAAKYRRLFEKTQKPTQTPVEQNQSQTSSSSTVDVDERILKAQGMNPELLKQLKDIAALKKVSLIDAQTDELFVAVKAQFEKEEKRKAAQVGASRGSGSVQVRKTLNTPGLSREEHMKLVKGS